MTVTTEHTLEVSKEAKRASEGPGMTSKEARWASLKRQLPGSRQVFRRVKNGEKVIKKKEGEEDEGKDEGEEEMRRGEGGD